MCLREENREYIEKEIFLTLLVAVLNTTRKGHAFSLKNTINNTI